MEKRKNLLFEVIRIALLVLVFIAVMFPLIYIIMASFKSNAEILTSGANILPKEFRFDNYVQAWKIAKFSTYTFNSLYMTFFIVVGNIITCTVLAYCFGRGNFIGKKFLYSLMLLTMFIAIGASSLYPQLQIAKMLGISKTLWGVIIIRVFGLSATNVFIGMSYLESISTEIDEAAKIDGCGFIRIYWNIIFPLLKPLVATIGLLTFRSAWNDYLLPMVFTIARPKQIPLIVGVVNLRNSGEAASSYNLMIAGASIAIVPMMVVYLFLNRFFIAGLTSGAVKG